jgi:hypothetical protein
MAALDLLPEATQLGVGGQCLGFLFHRRSGYNLPTLYAATGRRPCRLCGWESANRAWSNCRWAECHRELIGPGVPNNTILCPPDGKDPFKVFSGKGARYFDNVVAWPSVEPTDDYTVLGIVEFARLVSQ